MDLVLNPIEVRILGSLIEKEITTPDYYPLTLNALTLACNQKSSREPVMNLDEKTIIRVLDNLRFKQLVWQTTTMEGRVPKYKHNMSKFNFSSQELGIICALFLRGPQTPGELRIHTDRLCNFNDITEVESILQKLVGTENGYPYIVHLPREAGRKERRYAHLFCGEVTVDTTPPQEPAALEVQAENQRISSLELEISAMRKELNELKDQFAKFRKQFE
ncbi:YceH family protein [Candidatus Poribacteria bacterium]|nr:YceH family protein [Candidatus Poribacteria bacterium]